MMRIALIYLGRRGAGRWISLELAGELHKKFSVLTVTSEYMENPSEWETLESERLVVSTFRSAIQALFSLIFPLRINQLVKKVRVFQPDVLLFPMFHPWNGFIQRRLTNIPSVVFVHDPEPHPDLTGWFYSKLEQDTIRQAERCIILSKNLMDGMIARGKDMEKLDVIPLGLFRVTPSRKLNPSRQSFSTLLFFGRIVPYKGLEILLQAYADIRRTHQVRLLIAGEGDLTPYQSLLKDLPNVQVVNHWVPDDEIEKFFAESDLVVLPYTSGSQSGVIPMAASFGLPVIATRVGGIPEQITNGETGWLVEPNSKDVLATALREALDHPDLARGRGEALRRHYESELNWEKIALQVEESLMKANQARGPK